VRGRPHEALLETGAVNFLIKALLGKRRLRMDARLPILRLRFGISPRLASCLSQQVSLMSGLGAWERGDMQHVPT